MYKAFQLFFISCPIRKNDTYEMFLNTVSEAKKLHLSEEDVLKVYDAVKFNDRDCSFASSD